MSKLWQPLAAHNLDEIRKRFTTMFPAREYGDLAGRISEHWIAILERVWAGKDPSVKEKDLCYQPADPLSRIEQKTLLITYADSIQRPGETTLATLRDFLTRFFPAIRGIHLLPSCVVVEDRFNDGYFSQVLRNRIHERFGSNEAVLRPDGAKLSPWPISCSTTWISRIPAFRPTSTATMRRGSASSCSAKRNTRSALRKGLSGSVPAQTLPPVYDLPQTSGGGRDRRPGSGGEARRRWSGGWGPRRRLGK